MRLRLVISLALALATLAAYWPVEQADFLNIDDPYYVSMQPMVQMGLTPGTVRWAFTTFELSNWHPLTWISLMVDFQLFRLDPAGYHLVNLALHAANGVLLFLLFCDLTGAVWRSAFVAGLFLLHPLHVESVAWISERKDVLSTLLGLLAIWAFTRHARGAGRGFYAAAIASYAASLLAKPMLVTLPFLLLLLDLWPLGRLRLPIRWPAAAPLVVEKLPFFALMAASSAVTFAAQYTGGAVKTLEHYPVLIRISNSLVSYTDYLVKAFWPFQLSPFYPYQKIWVLLQVAAAALFLVVASVIALRYARSRPWLFVGWFWYLGTLVPVIGLVQVGSQAMADRYTYVPLIGIFLLLAWQVPDLLGSWRRAPAALAVAGAVVLAICGATTWRQVEHWRDNFTLFERAIELDPDNWLAHAFIGATYRRRGDLDLAIHHYRQALGRGVFGGKVRYQLAASLSERGDLDEALQMYNSVVRFDPTHAGAYNGAGEIVLARGDAAGAVNLFASAVSNDATSETYYRNLKLALLEQKRLFANQSFVPEAVSLLRPDDQMEYYMGGAQLFSAPKAPPR